MKNKAYKPVVLAILDGWGIGKDSKYNAISCAKTPVFDMLAKEYFSISIEASGKKAGLDQGEYGLSELGHKNLGSGRVIFKEGARISKAVEDKTFFSNEELHKVFSYAKESSKQIHFIGLLSTARIHSYREHFYALLEFAKKKKVKEVNVHAILDGIDAPKDNGRELIKELNQKIEGLGLGRITTIVGRDFAMNHANDWEKTRKAYELFVSAKGEEFSSLNEIFDRSYRAKIFDNEIAPQIAQGYKGINDGDVVVFVNFTGMYLKGIVQAFVLPSFNKFEKSKSLNVKAISLADYGFNMPLSPAFKNQSLKNVFAEVISKNGKNQLHMAETSKMAHVTTYFDGGADEPFENEDYILIPSPSDVEDYVKNPTMNVGELSRQLVQKISLAEYDFILVNFGNADEVGHSGNFQATVEAVEAIDVNLKELHRTVESIGGVLVITSDHGAVEVMKNDKGGTVNGHTTNPVPCIIAGMDFKGKGSNFLSNPKGALCDVAPTILKLMGLLKPKEMTGKSLV